jgi:hypothetical protein
MVEASAVLIHTYVTANRSAQANILEEPAARPSAVAPAPIHAGFAAKQGKFDDRGARFVKVVVPSICGIERTYALARQSARGLARELR